VAGTSYSGQYWGNVSPHRGDFPWVLQLHLDNVEVQNRARAGRGSFESFGVFQKERIALEAEFERRHKLSRNGYKRIIIWEFPFRDVKGMKTSIE
jgi:hypothetical protein